MSGPQHWKYPTGESLKDRDLKAAEGPTGDAVTPAADVVVGADVVATVDEVQ